MKETAARCPREPRDPDHRRHSRSRKPVARERVHVGGPALMGSDCHAHQQYRGPQAPRAGSLWRSEEHTSELQSHLNIVCRLLLEKKNTLIAESATAFVSPISITLYAIPSSTTHSVLSTL